MGMFVVQHSLNRQLEQKNKDKAMLDAIIKANSRIVHLTDVRQKPVNLPQMEVNQVIMSTKTMKQKNNYPYMWLLK